MSLLVWSSLSSCEADGGSAGDGASGDDDDAVDDDDSGADDDDSSVDDDDTTPDPEDPFPGDSIHMGDYEGLVTLQDSGIDLCTGTMTYAIDAEGMLTGSGSCEWIDGTQGDGGVPVVSFELTARFVDVGNMYGWEDDEGSHGPVLRQTYSWAPGESNEYLLDGTVSEGWLELLWANNDWMPTPDGEIQFQANANGELVVP